MSELKKATFAGGCFWCLEAVFKRVRGVEEVISGYAGGAGTPKYDRDILEKTGHAEVIQVTYNPKEISFDKLVEIFFKLHDPTTLNRQGNDVGTQYRSIAFYNNYEEKQIIENEIQKVTDEKYYKDPIVTELQPLEEFFPAETYHQDFYDSNRNYPYCKVIIDPKIQKLLQKFKEDIKTE